jgi:hypothetical protein
VTAPDPARHGVKCFVCGKRSTYHVWQFAGFSTDPVCGNVCGVHKNVALRQGSGLPTPTERICRVCGEHGADMTVFRLAATVSENPAYLPGDYHRACRQLVDNEADRYGVVRRVES